MQPGFPGQPAPVPGLGMPVMNTMPQPAYIQETLNRIAGHLNVQRKSIEECLRSIGAENIAGVHAYRSQEFCAQLEREFHLVNTESAQIAQHFCIPGQIQYVDSVRFSTQVTQE